MILSDKSLTERSIKERKEMEEAKDWWEKGQWNDIGDRILLDPFEPKNLGPCSYDLTVGEEYISLRDPYKTKQLQNGQCIDVGPGETVLILSQEYICLPTNLVGIIVPRARWIFEGTSICASRIEPTWYGKLLIGFTNMAKNPVALFQGEAFCTCYFVEALETAMPLTKDKVHFLGRTKIGRIEFAHIRPQVPISPEKVSQSDIDNVVDLHGTPWDIARGMFVLNQKVLQDYIDKDVAPNIVEEATSAAYKRAFEIQQRWFSILVIGGLTLLVGFLGLFGYLIHLVSSTP